MIELRRENPYTVLAPEVLDSFLQTVIWWYKNDSNIEQNVPNIFDVLFEEHLYSESFYQDFAESICWNRYQLGVGPEPNSEEFNASVYESAMEELGDIFDHYQPGVVSDCTRVLDELNLFYSYTNFNENVVVEKYENQPLQEVW